MSNAVVKVPQANWLAATPSSGNPWGAHINQLQTVQPITIEEDAVFVLQDEWDGAVKVSGRQLKTYLKVLHKLALEQFPEDFI